MAAKITKAVITAAGLGTRMLPVAKSIPKEMLPIVDKPAIQYQVEEASRAGITDILIITGRDKYSIENYFDHSPEYEYVLAKKQNTQALENLDRLTGLANIYYIRQKEPKGLGHAVLCAKAFAGSDDFLVMYGDDVIIGDIPAASELMETYERRGGSVAVAGVKAVAREDLSKYCSLKVSPADAEGEFYVYDMNEKPQTEDKIFSNYAILGRVILTPEIFPILELQPPGKNNEIQLTDSMKEYALRYSADPKSGMYARVFSGERHDMGSKFGFLRANVMEGLKNPETASDFKEFLKGLKF